MNTTHHTQTQHSPALGDVAGILLGVGGGPAAELGEVREGGLVVVMRVPARM